MASVGSVSGMSVTSVSGTSVGVSTTSVGSVSGTSAGVSTASVLLDQDSKSVGNSYTLLDLYNGQGYYPGVLTYDNVVFGGPGFGFSAAAGLKLVCNKNVSLDPAFYAAFARNGIYEGKNKGGENKFAFSYGIMLRVVMSDYFFAK